MQLYHFQNGWCSGSFEMPDDYVTSLEKHAGNLLIGATADSCMDVPPARFRTLQEAGKNLFKVELGPAGTYTIRNVPLYKTHGDTRRSGHSSDRAFIDRMVRNFWQTKHSTKRLFGDDSFAWLPKYHIGHTPADPDAFERCSTGFVDNCFRVEDFLFGDLVGLSKEALEEFKDGRYPDRSAEVDTKRARLLSVAALGFRTPHFGLPQMRPEHLRQQFDALVSKHRREGEIDYFLLTPEEFRDMTGTKKNGKKVVKFSKEQVADFLMKCQLDDELNEQFETAKSKAIQKHMDMAGAAPSGGGLMQIIQQVLQQMMTQKQNSEPSTSAYGMPGAAPQMNASENLDFESDSHHTQDADDDLEEEGTEEAGPDDMGIRKGKGKDDRPIDARTGDAETSEGGESRDGDIVTVKGEVKKHIASIKNRIKHTLSRVQDSGLRDQIEACFGDVTGALETQSGLLMRQGKALQNLERDNSRQRHARRTAQFTQRLTSMMEEGNAAVNTQDRMQHHLELLEDLNDEQAEKYLANLEGTPSIVSAKRISRHQAIVDRGNGDSLERVKHSQEYQHVARFGITPRQFAIADKWAALEESE